MHACASMLSMQRRTGALPGRREHGEAAAGLPGAVPSSQAADGPALATDLTCRRCGGTKGIDNFSRDRSRKSGRFPWCKSCQVENNRAHQQSDGEPNGQVCPLCDTEIRGHANRRYCSMKCKDRAKAVRDRFGLTVVQYRSLLEATGGRCPICLKVTTRWAIDHNHATGKVTGVVCTACNIGALSRTFHDVEFVLRLLAYLRWTPAEDLGIDATAAPAKAPNLHKMWDRDRQKVV